jgi:iron complex transport system substrate-binding protein
MEIAVRGSMSRKASRGPELRNPDWHRRRLLRAIGGAALCAGLPRVAGATRGPARIVALNWAFAEILLTLEVAPVAVNDLFTYGRAIGWPAMPPAVADVGIGGAPNFEVLSSIRPDRILITPAQEYLRAQLSKVAPVEAIGLFMPDGAPFRRAQAALLQIAGELGQQSVADRCLADAAATMAQARSSLKTYHGEPLYLVSFLDRRHARVFGRRSMFQDVLDMLGLQNAWNGSTNDFGYATVGIEALVQEPSARVVHILPLPTTANGVLSSAFWQNIPAVRQRGAISIGPVWPFGAVATAARFAELLARSLPLEPA